MIQHIFLVAAREFRQIAATRSFWITLLILPVALAVGPLAQSLLGDSDTRQVMLIDGGSGATQAVRQRIDLDEAQRVLGSLSRYVERHELEHVNPNAPWAQHDRWYTDAEAARFAADGGAEAVAKRLAAAAPEGTPEYEAPEPDYEIVDTPADIAGAAPDRLDALVQPHLDPPEDSDIRKLDYIVYVPERVTPQTPVRIWSNGRVSTSFVQTVQTVLTGTMRAQYLRDAGLAPEQSAAANAMAPAIRIDTPPPGGGREKVLIQSILPLLSAYILLMSLLLSGSWMLQGTVEERSNKLIETVLACISPDELMYGKLFGTVAVGLVMVLFWVACAAAAAFASHGMIADFLRPAMAPLASPGTALTMLYFFLAGYVMVSMIFLAIGAMSDSFRDAQSYLTPVILVIAMPFAFIAQAVMSQTGGLAVQVMTWVPIYTPFTMLARLGTGVPLWEVLGAGAVLAIFVVVEFIFLGRVFRHSLLAAGEKTSLKRIGQLMRRREA
ncbi:ABC transporter permease [Stakelama tenebrarum]|uniref:ABC transporter permease n=1 Tax=Stakelama tenebrarum TaxID=2711215 RepID=A0A6G6Y1R0_9SPHN|nr:ABC transporter permease [Sphingosinithalassobacter tenebrarum]QIG78747.1 ABC transporter permease [Sphingosinithalassobacter tenebrarum]